MCSSFEEQRSVNPFKQGILTLTPCSAKKLRGKQALRLLRCEKADNFFLRLLMPTLLSTVLRLSAEF